MFLLLVDVINVYSQSASSRICLATIRIGTCMTFMIVNVVNVLISAEFCAEYLLTTCMCACKLSVFRQNMTNQLVLSNESSSAA